MTPLEEKIEKFRKINAKFFSELDLPKGWYEEQIKEFIQFIATQAVEEARIEYIEHLKKLRHEAKIAGEMVMYNEIDFAIEHAKKGLSQIPH